MNAKDFLKYILVLVCFKLCTVYYSGQYYVDYTKIKDIKY